MRSVKTTNIQRVIRVIYDFEPISKPEIAKHLNLTMPSVHNFVTDLEKEGIVIEVGISESSGGRKAIYYGLNPNCGYLIGINMEPDHFITTVFNVKLDLLYQKRHAIDLEYRLKTLGDIEDEIKQAISQTGISKEFVLGIGVSVPGLVDYDTGTIRSIPTMPNWDDVPLKAYLERQLSIPVMVDNNANCLAQAESWTDPQLDHSVTAMIARIGLGAGVVDNGVVFRGANSFAGEVGHTCIAPNGLLCTCGEKGCIEAYYCQCEKILSESIKSALSKELNEITTNELNQFMQEADSYLQHCSQELAGYLTLAADTLVKCYSPKHLVIFCDWVLWSQDLRNNMVETIYARNRFLKKNEITITFASSSKNLHHGAIQVLQNELFGKNSSLISRLTKE